MVTSNTFKSLITGRKYQTRSKNPCKTKNLVYFITCKKCSLQYEERRRMPDIRTRKKEKPTVEKRELLDIHSENTVSRVSNVKHKSVHIDFAKQLFSQKPSQVRKKLYME